MTDSNFTPNFKYSIPLFFQIRYILSTYTPTREIDDSTKMNILVRIEAPNQLFRKLNTVAHEIFNTYTTVHNSTLLCCQNIEIFIIYSATRSRSVHENDQHVQGWNPTTIYFQKLNTMMHDRLEPYTTL